MPYLKNCEGQGVKGEVTLVNGCLRLVISKCGLEASWSVHCEVTAPLRLTPHTVGFLWRSATGGG